MIDGRTTGTTAPSTRGGWCQLGSAAAAEIMARSGYDWVCLDAQHGLFSPESVVGVVSALCAAVRTPVLVRTASSDAAEIGRVLDAGVAGVVVPTVQSAAQAREIVSAACYPPVGQRSWGPLDGLLGRPAAAPPEIHVMIEDRRGLDALDDIAGVDGITGIFVGPFDLSASLGTTPEALIAASGPLPRIVAACDAAGLRPGVFAGDAVRGDALRRLGFRMIATGLDAALLRTAARADATR